VVHRRDADEWLTLVAAHQQPVGREDGERGLTAVEVLEGVASVRVGDGQFHVQAEVRVPALLRGEHETGRVRPRVQVLEHDLHVRHWSAAGR
jgi:hypothetical protein